jgi:hypothetical protein
VPGSLPVRFPRPLPEPDVRLSPHPALHEARGHALFGVHGVGMLRPR